MTEKIKKIVFSFRNAFKGIIYVIRKERNFQIELIFALVVFLLMFIVGLQKWEQTILFLVIFTVLILEMLNTAVERMVNLVKPKMHPYARVIKDITAGAVLLASFGSIVIALIIFLPYILGL